MFEVKNCLKEVIDCSKLGKLFHIVFHHKISLNLLKLLSKVPSNKCERKMSCQVVATPIVLV